MELYARLRIANVTRQKEWDKDGGISLSYRGNELTGETGEACNIIKKLDREKLGIRGSRATPDQLAEELADVIICADLVGATLSVDLAAAVIHARPREWAYIDTLDPAGGLSFLGNLLGRCVGEVNRLLDLIARRDLQPESDDGSAWLYGGKGAALARVCLVVEKIASLASIDLDDAVIDKFNATSRKVGLTTMMATHG